MKPGALSDAPLRKLWNEILQVRQTAILNLFRARRFGRFRIRTGACVQEAGRYSGTLGRLHVAQGIANENAALKVEIKVCGGREQHARLRLAPWMVSAVFHARCLGMVGTMIDRIEGCATFGEKTAHPVHKAFKGLFGKNASPDAGLVCYHDDSVAERARVIADIEYAFDEFDFVAPVDEIGVDIDHAVAIEK